MHTDWFFMSTIPDVGSIAELDEAEARHALGSRRLLEGETITLFDGQGLSATAKLTAVSKRSASAEILSREMDERPAHTITLASALPKGDRQAVMLNMAAQLGVQRIVPLQCERAVAKVSKGFTARTQRIIIEACKQSRQAFFPVIEDARTPAEIAQHQSEQVLIADVTGEAIAGVHIAAAVTLMVGPEGGFTEREVASVREQGGTLVSLGESILRTETAAVAMCAWARFALHAKT